LHFESKMVVFHSWQTSSVWNIRVHRRRLSERTWAYWTGRTTRLIYIFLRCFKSLFSFLSDVY
jgi:hypothetical protein